MAMNAQAKTYLQSRVTAISDQLARLVTERPNDHNHTDKIEAIEQIGRIQKALASPTTEEGGSSEDREFIVTSYRVLNANGTANTDQGNVLEHRLLIDTSDGTQVSNSWYNISKDPATALTDPQVAALDVENDLESTGTSTSSGGISIAEVNSPDVATLNSAGTSSSVSLVTIDTAVVYTVVLELAGFSTDVVTQLEGQMPGSTDWITIAPERILTGNGADTQIGNIIMDAIRVNWKSGTATSLGFSVYASGYSNVS